MLAAALLLVAALLALPRAALGNCLALDLFDCFGQTCCSNSRACVWDCGSGQQCILRKRVRLLRLALRVFGTQRRDGGRR